MVVPPFDHIYILHGCPQDSEHVTPIEKRWMNWVADELGARGLPAEAPQMPEPWIPVYAKWKEEFEKYPLSENSLLVGHSCAGAFLVRYLADTGKKVKKLILVAPAKVPQTGDDTRAAMYDFELPADGSKLADEIVMFISNDFPHHLKARELYINALHPRIVDVPNKGHFLFAQMGTVEFPELLDEILR